MVLVVFHHTDTHIYILSLALALSIHNKQQAVNLCACLYFLQALSGRTLSHKKKMTLKGLNGSFGIPTDLGQWLGQIRTHHRDEDWFDSLWQTFFDSCVGENIPVLTDLPLSTWFFLSWSRYFVKYSRTGPPSPIVNILSVLRNLWYCHYSLVFRSRKELKLLSSNTRPTSEGEFFSTIQACVYWQLD